MRGAGVGLAAVATVWLCLGGQGTWAQPLPPARPGLIELPLPPEVPQPFASGSGLPRGRDLYYPLAAAEAKALGLPPEVADAVMRVESGYDPSVVGGAGERGLMQVMPPTASLLGFKGSMVELADPATNIRLGTRYLAQAWRLSGGDLCRALMKYRAGHNEERMSALSVEYCRRAKSHLAALGSPLGAGALPAVNFGAASLPSGRSASAVASVDGLGRRGRRRVVVNRNRFWAAHMARIKAIEARLPWKRGGILAGT